MAQSFPQLNPTSLRTSIRKDYSNIKGKQNGGVQLQKGSIKPFRNIDNEIKAHSHPSSKVYRNCICSLLLFALDLILFDYMDLFFATFILLITILGPLYCLITYIATKLQNSLVKKNEVQTNEIELISFSDKPSVKWAINPEESKFTDLSMNKDLQIDGPFRQYSRSDRISPQKDRQVTIQIERTEAQIDNLALNDLKELNISQSLFSQYVNNLKKFFVNTMLSKLEPKLRSEDQLAVQMLSVPSYEHCKDYILERISALAHSPYLSGHFGSRGNKWKGHEWTKELPSDNQIIMHAFSTWVSYFMNGKRVNTNVFLEQFLSIGQQKKNFEKNHAEFFLCSPDWNMFYILKKNELSESRYYAFPGIDSMYNGLTLLLYFIMKEKDFMIGGADLTTIPFCLDNVFSITSIN